MFYNCKETFDIDRYLQNIVKECNIQYIVYSII